MFITGQIFNQTEELGGKLSGVGDLIKELQDAINEDSDQDVIDSFADFLQVDFTLCYFDIYYNNYIQCVSCRFSFL